MRNLLGKPPEHIRGSSAVYRRDRMMEQSDFASANVAGSVRRSDETCRLVWDLEYVGEGGEPPSHLTSVLSAPVSSLIVYSLPGCRPTGAGANTESRQVTVPIRSNPDIRPGNLRRQVGLITVGERRPILHYTALLHYTVRVTVRLRSAHSLRRANHAMWCNTRSHPVARRHRPLQCSSLNRPHSVNPIASPLQSCPPTPLRRCARASSGRCSPARSAPSPRRSPRLWAKTHERRLEHEGTAAR